MEKMNFEDDKNKLTEQEINQFIEACPEIIDGKQFMALVCLMSQHYGFEPETVQRMLMRIVNYLEIFIFETSQENLSSNYH